MTAPSDPASPDSHAAPAAVSATIARVWELRRLAETRPFWARPALGVLFALGFVVIARPELLPGGLATSLAALAVVAAVAVAGIALWSRRSSFRGHSGSAQTPLEECRWWRSPALAPPVLYALAFVGTLTGAFEYWPVVISGAIAVGVVAAAVLPRYETADHMHGTRFEHPPRLTPDAEVALADGDLTSDVLELLVLQHHTGERRISWCADVLDIDIAEIRDRIRRGHRWLELPATEVHDPTAASWVRLSPAGRKALG